MVGFACHWNTWILDEKCWCEIPQKNRKTKWCLFSFPLPCICIYLPTLINTFSITALYMFSYELQADSVTNVINAIQCQFPFYTVRNSMDFSSWNEFYSPAESHLRSKGLWRHLWYRSLCPSWMPTMWFSMLCHAAAITSPFPLLADAHQYIWLMMACVHLLISVQPDLFEAALSFFRSPRK